MEKTLCTLWGVGYTRERQRAVTLREGAVYIILES